MARPVQVTTILTDDKLEWEKKTPEEVREIIAEIIRSRETQLSQETDSEPQETDSKPQETDSEPQETDSKPQETDSKPQETDSKPQKRYSELQETNSESLEKYSEPQGTDLELQTKNSGRDSHNQQLRSFPNSDFDSHLELCVKKDEDDLWSLVHKSYQSSEPILKQGWLYIVDSGGQPEFHDMLSAFVQNATACIFVFRMHDELDDCPPVAFYKDGGSVGSPLKSRLTNKQIFKQFMRTMRSFSSKENGDPPNIVLLATHRDQVRLPNLLEKSELPDQLEERKLEEWNQHLKPIVLPQFKGQLIYCDRQLEKFIFTMNAQKPEEKDKQTAKAIQKVITEKCLMVKEEIPIRWYFLDHRARKISDDLKRKVKVLSRKEYGRIAESLNIDNESCEQALNFFNRLNIIFYFPTALPSVVFLDPQILLDLLSKLVAKKYRQNKHSPVEAIEPKEYDFQFHDFAQVTETLLSEFAEHYHPHLFTSSELVVLFETLLIFGKLGEKKWFVPSVLPCLKEEEVEQYRVSKEKALLIHFPDGGPQNGLFCSTVSYLLSSYNNSPSPWKVLTDSYSKPTCLKRNVISFTVHDFPVKVTLIEEWTHFEVHTKNRDPECEDEVWKLVHDAVFCGLEKATKTHHYSNTLNIPRPAIKCPEQDNDHPSIPHPATINRKGKWKCTQSNEYGGKVTETIPWLNLLPPGKFVRVCVECDLCTCFQVHF